MKTEKKYFAISLGILISCSFAVSNFHYKAVAEMQVIESSSSSGYEYYNNTNQDDTKNYSSGSTTYMTDKSNNTKKITVNRPIPLSYKTKEEIFNIRKKYVATSIFNIPNYKPSEEVFGQIEDEKPWISLRACSDKQNRSDISGPSEESRFILNPTALVMLNWPFSQQCVGNTLDQLNHDTISTIEYNEAKKEIIVKYNKLNFVLANYTFCGINARDLGYKYAFIDLSKSTYDLKFKENENIGNTVVEFQDFLHTGGSCGLEGGCNNGSPYQPMLIFFNTYNKNSGYKKDKEIYIKLWKEMPYSPYEEPDIVERIIIENA